MGTETRIGIATGLVIVVVASVYFFYGSDRSEGDLLMVSSARLDEVPAVPPSSATRKDSAARRPAVKPPASKLNKRRRRARRAAGEPRSRGNSDRTSVAKRRTAPPVKPRSRGLGTTPNAPRTPVRDASAGSTKVAAQRKPPTRLRSEPSSILIDATKKNLEQSPTGAKPKPAKAGAPNDERPKRAPGARPGAKSGAKASKAGAKRPRHNSGVHLPGRKPTRGAGKARPTAKAGRRAGASSKKASLPTQRPASKTQVAVWPRRHTIVAGDTLTGISSHYYGTSRSVARILKANAGVKNPRNLRIGNVLVIPAPEHLATAKAVKRGSVPNAVKLATAPTPRTVKADAPPSRTYRVRPGDSFYTIAKKMYGKPGRWKAIYAANRVIVKNNPRRLRPGMMLRIPK